MTYRHRLTVELVDVLTSLDRAVTLYEQLLAEVTHKDRCRSLDSRMKVLKVITEQLVDDIQMEILRKAGYDGHTTRASRPAVGPDAGGVSAGAAPAVFQPRARPVPLGGGNGRRYRQTQCRITAIGAA